MKNTLKITLLLSLAYAGTVNAANMNFEGDDGAGHSLNGQMALRGYDSQDTDNYGGGSGSSSDNFGSGSNSNSDNYGSGSNSNSDNFGSGSNSNSDNYGSGSNSNSDNFGSGSGSSSDKFGSGSGSSSGNFGGGQTSTNSLTSGGSSAIVVPSYVKTMNPKAAYNAGFAAGKAAGPVHFYQVWDHGRPWRERRGSWPDHG